MKNTICDQARLNIFWQIMKESGNPILLKASFFGLFAFENKRGFGNNMDRIMRILEFHMLENRFLQVLEKMT